MLFYESMEKSQPAAPSLDPRFGDFFRFVKIVAVFVLLASLHYICRIPFVQKVQRIENSWPIRWLYLLDRNQFQTN